MKKVFLILVLAFAGFLANASNSKVSPKKSFATPQSIEWQSNMKLVDPQSPNKQKAGDCYYLGTYHVFIDGEYQGIYDVYIC